MSSDHPGLLETKLEKVRKDKRRRHMIAKASWMEQCLSLNILALYILNICDNTYRYTENEGLHYKTKMESRWIERKEKSKVIITFKMEIL